MGKRLGERLGISYTKNLLADLRGWIRLHFINSVSELVITTLHSPPRTVRNTEYYRSHHQQDGIRLLECRLWCHSQIGSVLPSVDLNAPLDLATLTLSRQATWPKSFVGRGEAGRHTGAVHSQERRPRLLPAALRCILLRNLVSLTLWVTVSCPTRFFLKRLCHWCKNPCHTASLTPLVVEILTRLCLSHQSFRVMQQALESWLSTAILRHAINPLLLSVHLEPPCLH